jgi:AraC-like DNA-binding protein
VKTILLCIEDVPLILVVFQCFLLSLLLLMVSDCKKASNLFLSLILLGVGLDAFNTLIYWSPTIKNYFFDNSVNIFFLFRCIPYIIAPLLHLYTKSVVYPNYALTKYEWLHFIPFILFPLYLWVLYHTYTDEELLRSTIDYSVLFNNPVFQVHLWAQNGSYAYYGLLSCILLCKYEGGPKEIYSDITIDLSWLKVFIGGFIGLWLWNLMRYILSLVHIPQGLGDKLGVMSNLLLFIFINTLIIQAFVKSSNARKLTSLSASSHAENKEQKNVDLFAIERLTKAMCEEKLFLDPELTIQQLAQHTGLPIRRLSNILNRHFKLNFYDYINQYRIERAKEILTTPDHNLSLLEVMHQVGFNSKPTFYRAFKKQLKLTPTQFYKLANSAIDVPPRRIHGIN